MAWCCSKCFIKCEERYFPTQCSSILPASQPHFKHTGAHAVATAPERAPGPVRLFSTPPWKPSGQQRETPREREGTVLCHPEDAGLWCTEETGSSFNVQIPQWTPADLEAGAGPLDSRGCWRGSLTWAVGLLLRLAANQKLFFFFFFNECLF